MTIPQSSSSKQDILNHLLRKGEANAKELAQNLEISPQAIRRHLKDLEAEGLIEHELVQPKMGRPRHLYRLTRQGRDRLPNGYGEFAVAFLDTLSQTLGQEQVNTVLRKQWQRKAWDYQQRIGSGNLQERVNNLLKLRQAEGYMAELYQTTKNAYILAEHNCAISEVAESYPTVCGHELEMFASILPDCKIERTHWINNGEHRCGYLIQPKSN